MKIVILVRRTAGPVSVETANAMEQKPVNPALGTALGVVAMADVWIRERIARLVKRTVGHAWGRSVGRMDVNRVKAGSTVLMTVNSLVLVTAAVIAMWIRVKLVKTAPLI